jgi:radical SAM superfamily enzyme YgiQ (UPF0313 family)
MKIIFVNPSSSEFQENKIYFSIINKILWSVIASPPLTFQMLAAVTPEEHQMKLIDERYQKIDFNEECDLVGISSTTPCTVRAYEIADEFRKRGIKVVLGGWHPSALPHEAKQHSDAVVIGDAEESWPQLLKDIESEKLKPFYERPVNLKTIPAAERKRLLHNGGCFLEEIQATRGCNMSCKYCAVTNSKYGYKVRFRPIENVIEEIRSTPQKSFYFNDSSLTLNPKYTKQLFKAMKGLNKKFSCNGNIGILCHDDELLKLANEAGCIEWAIGFESISQESLHLIGKRTNKVEEFVSTIDKIHKFGMGVKGNFMFGMDGDHPDIFDKTIDAICDWELDLASFSILIPFPGTPLFESLEKEKRILTNDWSKYDTGHVVFQPKHMSPQELLDETTRVRKTFCSTYNNITRSVKCLKFGPYSFLTTGLANFFN